MALLRVNGVSKEFGSQVVLDSVSFEINPNDKWGLVGANGCGKTTLLKILIGEEKASRGSFVFDEEARIGYVPQSVTCPDDVTILDYLLKEHKQVELRLREAEKQLAECAPEDLDKKLNAFQKARDLFEEQGGDNYAVQAERMLAAFGLDNRTNQTVMSLSGGERNLVSLTGALLNRPDLLILDEPANHLDYVGIAWLEDFLKKYKGAILLVSHNRYLLDQVTKGTLELKGGQIKYFPGNYSDYRAQKLEQQIRLEKEHAAYEKRLASLEAMILRIRNFAQVYDDKRWGKMLRSRESKIEQLKQNAAQAPEKEEKKTQIRFQGESSHANIAIQVRGFSASFDGRLVLDHVDLDISSGERVALVGPNGSGKSTLIKAIMNDGHWENPTLRVGPSITIGYCSQQQETLDPENTVFEEIAVSGITNEKQAYDLLARFLFVKEELKKKVKDLSGGEKNRLQLAKLMLINPNTLILDEPTNHLDIQTCEAVEEALGDYKGTLIVVSHDRYFLDKLATRIVEVDNKKLHSYPGSYSEFWFHKKEREQKEAKESKQSKKEQPKQQQNQAAGANKPLSNNAKQKLAKQEADLTNKIESLEAKIEDLDKQIAEAFAQANHELGRTLTQEKEQSQQELNSLYTAWENFLNA
ncbi:ABC-F family ATP-binding cassette domain-containing protein [bacterium]|nr:ABC-F family ATP-binding cassette domain-containing protein [bacterium]